MTHFLTIDVFKPHLGKTFRVRDGRHQLTLEKIEEHRVRPEDAPRMKRLPFTLIFRGASGDILQEGLQTLEVADETESFELYIIPVHTPLQDRQDYQVAVN